MRAKQIHLEEGEGCTVDKMVGKYGPYRYQVKKRNGRQIWKYLGRSDGLVSSRRQQPEQPTEEQMKDAEKWV